MARMHTCAAVATALMSLVACSSESTPAPGGPDDASIPPVADRDGGRVTSPEGGSGTCTPRWKVELKEGLSPAAYPVTIAAGALKISAAPALGDQLEIVYAQPLAGDFDVKIQLTSFSQARGYAMLEAVGDAGGGTMWASVGSKPLNEPGTWFSPAVRLESDSESVPNPTFPVALRLRRVGPNATATVDDGVVSTTATETVTTDPMKLRLRVFTFVDANKPTEMTFDDLTSGMAGGPSDDFACDSIAK